MPAWANVQNTNNNAELEELVYQGECAKEVLPYAGAADVLALALWAAEEKVKITLPVVGVVGLRQARQVCMKGVKCIVPKGIQEDILFQALNNPDAIADKNMPGLLRAIRMELPRPMRAPFQRLVELARTCPAAQRLVLRLVNGDWLAVLDELVILWHLRETDPVKKEVDEIMGFKTDVIITIDNIPHELMEVIGGEKTEYNHIDLPMSERLAFILQDSTLPF